MMAELEDIEDVYEVFVLTCNLIGHCSTIFQIAYRVVCEIVLLQATIDLYANAFHTNINTRKLICRYSNLFFY